MGRVRGSRKDGPTEEKPLLRWKIIIIRVRAVIF